jgi:hypothetical protein
MTWRRIIRRQNGFILDSQTVGAKRLMRKRWRQWRRTDLTVDYELFKCARNNYISLLRIAKRKCLRDSLMSSDLSTKRMWDLLALHTGSALKSSRKVRTVLTHAECLWKADAFAQLFTEKISCIIDKLSLLNPVPPPFFDSIPSVTTILHEFEPINSALIQKYLRRISSAKSSPDDVIQPRLLKQNDGICYWLANLCNLSFKRGNFPQGLKRAIITPVLKKRDMDPDVAANYRPISNLKVVGKVMETVVAVQLEQHLTMNGYLHPMQSAYRKFASTETATLYVSSEWRRMLDVGRLVCVVSLDVFAAFDTVNHHILCLRLIQAGVLGLINGYSRISRNALLL